MLGYFLALIVGLSLGLLGGGGSILTVPILVYIMDIGPKPAIALSLAIVGATSLIGLWGHIKNKNIDYKIALIFGPVAMVGAFLGAKVSQFISGQAQLIFFATIMLLASFFMFKGRSEDENKNVENRAKSINIPLLIIEAIIVGIITGLVGVGGGFLIVPALVLLTKISIKKAVSTSLFIIALNSFTGFVGYIGVVAIPWAFLLKFTFFSSIGIIIGSFASRFISQKALRKIFAIFLVVMGVFIFYKNRGVLF